MIIESFDFCVRSRAGDVYRGSTTFGFFSKSALAQQVGIRDAKLFDPPSAEPFSFAYPSEPPYPDTMLRMVDRVECFSPTGGPRGLGYIRGETDVDPDAWFFKAHFYQDPVWPGSLGLESFLQLLHFAARRRWPSAMPIESVALGTSHMWMYRGQIIPTNRRVTVEASIAAVDGAQRTLCADGLLSVDGRVIYQMSNFTVRMHPS
jgi:3-hydroxymyristoyl/3-hydroxydecanoyl-(acyl carrier protein) dehydratase